MEEFKARYEDLRGRLEGYANLKQRRSGVALQAEADCLQEESRFARQVLGNHDARFAGPESAGAGNEDP